MTLFVLILLVFIQTISQLALFGLALYSSRFRFPFVAITILSAIADSVVSTAQFWWLFHVWYQSFVWGCIAISAAILILGVVWQIYANSISSEKNVHANVSLLLLLGRQTVSYQLFGTLAALLWLIVLYKAYAISRGQVTSDTIKSATFLFFTGASVPSLIFSATQMVGNALKPSLDPLTRNVVAIASLGGYGLSAWRAAFPFFLFGGTVAAMGYELSLPMMLAAVAGTYAVFVIIPLALGERRYTQEHSSVITAACAVLDDITRLDRPKLDSSIFEEERTKLARELNELLINLYDDDAFLRFFAFWRWGPNRAFHQEGMYWVLNERISNGNDSGIDQPLGVLDRPWFQQLIGPKKRVRRRFNDSTVESLTALYLEKIPNWN
jgi:hypothetical protein